MANPKEIGEKAIELLELMKKVAEACMQWSADRDNDQKKAELDRLTDQMNKVADELGRYNEETGVKSTRNIQSKATTEPGMIKELVDSMRETEELGKNKLREYYRGKTVPELKEALADMSMEDLHFLCESVALPTEDYEICQAAHELMEEKKKK